mgnify:CR=1 FL=1
MSKYEVKLVNIGEEVDNRIRELEIEVKDIRKANDNLTRANESYRQENIDLRKEQFGVEVAMLTKKVDDLDYVITTMLETDGPVIADIRIEKEENCFPMIPSGSAHNEMLLSAAEESNATVSEEGKILV